jgi:hypothetical protein
MMLDRAIVCDKPIVDSIFDLLKMPSLARTRSQGDWGETGPRLFATRTARASHRTLVPVPDRILNGSAINCFFSLSAAIFVRSPINLYQIAHRFEYFGFAISASI